MPPSGPTGDHAPSTSGHDPEDALLRVEPISLRAEGHAALDPELNTTLAERRLRNLPGWLRQLSRSPMARWLAILGPGLIAANAGNDAGGIVTYSTVGAQYGYGLLWMMLIITFSLAVVQEMCARLGAATGKGLSDLIRENLPLRWTALTMVALLLANVMLVMSEFGGVGASTELFGVSRYISVPVVAFAVWWLVSRGSYARVEKIFLVFTFAFFAYIVSAFTSKGINWGDVARHTVIPSISLQPAYVLLFVATVGTTITPYMQLFYESAVVEKGVTMREYRYERADAYFGAIFSNLIAFFIIIATAINIYYHGGPQTLNTPTEAAAALRPVAGSFAVGLFGIGLFGASMLAAGVLPIATAYSICEAFGFEKGVAKAWRQAPIFWAIFTGIIILGALVPLLPGLPIFQLLIIVQALNAIILPIILFSLVRLVNNRELMGPHVNGPITNVIAWGTVGFVSLLSVILIVQTVLGFFGVTFG